MPSSRVAHHRIRSITIEDSVHYKRLHLDVPDGLTTISGGFGSGKTTLGLFLCYALDAKLPPPTHERKPLAQIAARLGHGKITVRTRSQHGVDLTVTRTWNQKPVVTDAQGRPVEGALDGELFRIDAYLQGHIKEIASTPAALLDLIDGFAPAETRQAGETIDETLRLLARNAAELRKLDEELAGASQQVAELPSVEAALGALVAPSPQDPAAAQATQAAHAAKVARGKEATSLEVLARETGAVKSALDGFTVDALRRLGGGVDGAHERGPSGALFTRAHGCVQALAAAIEAAAGKLRGETEVTLAALGEAGRGLAAAHAQADEDYRKLLVRLEEDRGQAEERERLQKRVVDLGAMNKRAAQRSADRAARQAERRSLLARLAAARKALSQIRQRVAGELNDELDGAVQVDVQSGADATACTALLADVLTRLGLRGTTLGEIARSIPFDELAEAARAKDVARLVAVDKSKTGKVERATNILTELAASDRLYDLETSAPGDVPRLRLRVGPRPDYVDVATGSPGQRCTATLAILMLQSVGLLFIDQPEDNVDAAYLHDVFVPSLRTAKPRRQIVVITHAPNIPVLGEAELVVFVEPDGTAGRLRSAGDVDAQRNDIELHLEGGRAAFVKRAETYGHAPRKGGETDDDRDDRDDGDDGDDE